MTKSAVLLVVSLVVFGLLFGFASCEMDDGTTGEIDENKVVNTEPEELVYISVAINSTVRGNGDIYFRVVLNGVEVTCQYDSPTFINGGANNNAGASLWVPISTLENPVITLKFYDRIGGVKTWTTSFGEENFKYNENHTMHYLNGNAGIAITHWEWTDEYKPWREEPVLRIYVR